MTKDEIIGAAASIEKLKENNSINEEQYYKSLISLSNEYLKINEVTNGVELLSRCEPDYFKSQTFKKQLEEDKEFFDSALSIANFLVKFSIVSLDKPEFRPTQKLAHA